MNRKTYEFDIVAFDCDSTLSAVEGIDLLAQRHGIKREVEEITHKAMNGHGSFAEALALRLDLVRPTREDLAWLGSEYVRHALPGVKEVISDLRDLNRRVYVVSGGFRGAINILAGEIGIDRECILANDLLFDEDGAYLGFDQNNPMSQNQGKVKVLRELSNTGRGLFVGDGATDLEAKEVVDLFVGFGGICVREKVKQMADIFIEEPSLRKIVKLTTGKNREMRVKYQLAQL